MHDTEESRTAKRILDALELGGRDLADVAVECQDIDPVLVHAIVSYVRQVYRNDDSAGPAVLKRLVDLTAACPGLQAKNHEGARDPIIEWFNGSYDWKDYRGRSAALVDLLVDKLES